MLDSVFDRFVEKSPISVIARGMMERALNPQLLDEWFKHNAEKQYTRNLLFSSVFDIMSQVVTGSRESVHAAYQASSKEIGVSVISLYNKLNGIEVNTSAELVRYAAGAIEPVIRGLKGTQPPLLPGYKTKFLDGNCIEATDHRIKELRDIAAGALPGKSLVVYDPELRMPVDVFPCPDGHAQERSLLNFVLSTVNKKDLWIADRNFNTIEFTCGIADKGAFFAFRQHGNLPYTAIQKEKRIGKIDTGEVFEQPVIVIDYSGNEHRFRRIRVVLKKETRDGDKEIWILTNLSQRAAGSKEVSNLYRCRWTIETSFQELKKWFNSEINTLGYPPAALFGFCVALVSYMIVSVIKASLCSVYGWQVVEKKVSGYYLSDEISATYRGMLIAIYEDEWKVFRQLTQKQFIALLKKLSTNVNLSQFLKHPRGPKKPRSKRISDPKHPHVSTAKIIENRKK